MVRNFDRNGKPIEDLSKVTIKAEDFPALIELIAKKKEEKVA